MSQKSQKFTRDFQAQAEKAISAGDWQAAATFYAQCVEPRASELALINSVQEGLLSRLDMQGIYNLVGDKLRDTFNAQKELLAHRFESAKTICTKLWEAVDAHSGEMPHQDDFVMVVIKRQA